MRSSLFRWRCGIVGYRSVSRAEHTGQRRKVKKKKQKQKHRTGERMQLVSRVFWWGGKKTETKRVRGWGLIRSRRQRAGVVRRHLNTGQQQLESVSNSSVLHTASPSGERGVARTLLESSTVSHFPQNSP